MALPLLQSDAIESALAELPGWSSQDGALHREYRFPDFESAFAFMTNAALHIVKLDHHPEWTNVYNRLRVSLSTHDSGGVTKRDVTLAKLMETLSKRFAE